LIHQKTEAVQLASYNYQLKANGMRHSLDESLNEDRSIIYTYDNLNRLTQEDASSNDGSYTSTYEYDLAGNRTYRQINVNGQTLTTDYVYDPSTDQLVKETHSGPVYSFVQGNEQYYAYANGSKLLYYRDLRGNKIGHVKAFLTGLPSVWNKYLFILAMALVPILLFGPAVVSVIRRLTLYHGRPTRLRPAVPRKGICLLVAFVMLLGPEHFHSLAQAQVQYSDLNTATWANGDTTIEYTYDANGSVETKTTKVTSTQAVEETVVNSYNLANRLETVTTTRGDTVEVVEYTYNDDGIRVKSEFIRTVSGVTDQTRVTAYLIDPYNHTGYSQTLEEETITTDYIGGVPQTPVTETTTYLIGDDVIAQTKDDVTQYLLYDGQGSTRQLAEYDGSVTIADSYSYDAYGILLQNDAVASANPGKVSQQATNLLYTGEHFDVDSQNYYLRARWYNPLNGLFNRVDPYSGNMQDPQSLHKYLYCHANPINSTDPSGEFSIVVAALNVLNVVGIISMVMTISLKAVGIGLGMKQLVELEDFMIELWRAPLPDLIQKLLVRNLVGTLSIQIIGKVFSLALDIIRIGISLLAWSILLRAVIGFLRSMENAASLATAAKQMEPITDPSRLLPAPKMQGHHIFPQDPKFAKFFTKAGIVIDDYVVDIEQTTHLKGVHGRGIMDLPGKWNNRWTDFFKKNPKATAKQIFQFAGRLMDEFNLSDLPIRSK
jgi:RHS repeat-associated protein